MDYFCVNCGKEFKNKMRECDECYSCVDKYPA